MYKFYYMIIVCLLFTACSDKVKETQTPAKEMNKQSDITMHPDMKRRPGEEMSGLAEAIKKQTLPDYPDKTIGKAFDSYSFFTKKEWRESFAGKGKLYVDFIGWMKPSPFDVKNIKNDISARGIVIKFVITPDGPFYIGMVSRVELKTDGKIYEEPLPDIKKIVQCIYESKEIVF